MSQVQNNTALNYIQPLLITGIAYLAGSKRFIQHFPGASQGGLALAGGLGSLFAYGSQKAVAHKWPGKEESFLLSFARVSTAFGISTLATHFIAKSLKGRVNLSLPAAGKFIAVEAALTLGLAGVSHYQTSKSTSPPKPKGSAKPDGKDKKTPEELLQADHAKYAKGDWDALTSKEQSTWVQKFYAANLPLIPLTSYSEDEESAFDTAPFETIKDLSGLSKNQQAWYVEIYCFHLIPQGKEILSKERVPTVGENKRCLQQLHAYFSAHPIKILQAAKAQVKNNLNAALEKHGLDPLCKNNKALESFTEKMIQELSVEDLTWMRTLFNGKKNDGWNALTVSQQQAFNAAFEKAGLKRK